MDSFFRAAHISVLLVSADLNNVRFSAYRTAIKIRRLQKALCCEFGLWDRLLLYSTWGREGQLKSISTLVFNKGPETSLTDCQPTQWQDELPIVGVIIANK